MRGRKPKPTAIKIAEGNPGQHKLRDDAAIPPAGELVPPATITGAALEEWRALIPVVTAMGVGTTADVNALARYCDHLVHWKKAAEFLRANGTTYAIRARSPVYTHEPDPDKPGKTRRVASYPVIGMAQYPQFTQYRDLSALLLRFEAEFGLTASSRTRVAVRPIAPGDTEADAQAKADFFEPRLTG